MGKKPKPKPQLEHYLLTLYVGPHHHMHSYVMTDDKRAVTAVLNEMIELLADAGIKVSFPMALMTLLNPDGVEIVRELLRSEAPQEFQEALDKATDFHRSTWMMTASNPSDGRLMELH